MNTWMIGVLVTIALAGIVAWWWWPRSRNKNDKSEAVSLIPHMVKDWPSPAPDLARLLVRNCDEYGSNASGWGFAYFSSVFGSAFLSAIAALILKLDFLKGTPDYRADEAACCATLAALLVTLSTVVDFRRKWQACRAAEVGVQNLAYDLFSKGARSDAKAILEHLTIINTGYNQAIGGATQAGHRERKTVAH